MDFIKSNLGFIKSFIKLGTGGVFITFVVFLILFLGATSISNYAQGTVTKVDLVTDPKVICEIMFAPDKICTQYTFTYDYSYTTPDGVSRIGSYQEKYKSEKRETPSYKVGDPIKIYFSTSDPNKSGPNQDIERECGQDCQKYKKNMIITGCTVLGVIVLSLYIYLFKD